MENKLFFLKLYIKSKFYKTLCYFSIHPKTYYKTSFRKENRFYKFVRIVDVHKCKLCGKEVTIERR